jgi:hypothetical protein
MKITPELLRSPQTQTELDLISNTLLVDLNRFAAVACADGRFHGVETLCDSCSQEFNACLRRHALTGLLQAQIMVEKNLNYAVTPRFYAETQPWDGVSRLVLKHPGLKTFGVRESIASAPGTTVFPVTPYLINNLSLVDTGEGYCVAQLPRNLVANPDQVQLRTSGGLNVEQDIRFGYPRRTSSHWELAIPYAVGTSSCSGPLNVQHCRYLVVTTDTKTVTTGEVLPVYTGTLQKIPVVKKVVDGTNTHWWFNVWDLFDPEFFEQGMNWGQFETYKLLDSIELKHFTTIAAEAVITYRERGKDTYNTIAAPDFKIHDYRNSVVEIMLPPALTGSCYDREIVSVAYHYHTTPELLLGNSGESLATAISYLVAAELPLEVCKCDVDHGFIKTAQSAYSKVVINPVTGMQYENFEYGSLYGQVTFKEILSRIPHYVKVVKL